MKHRSFVTALLAVSMMGTMAGCGLKSPETQASSFLFIYGSLYREALICVKTED